MLLIGEVIIFFSAVASLIYGITILAKKTATLYFQLIVCALACYVLGYIFDVCEFIVHGTLSGGYTIGYLGSIGCFLFLLTASYGYMDGILDDKTKNTRKSKYIALIAPVAAIALLIPNVAAELPNSIKISYSLLWIPAILHIYFCFKHSIIPDMGYGFVEAIRPYNVSALLFSILQLIHLTLWNFAGWIPLMLTGLLLGASCIVMVVTAYKGVEKWKH